MAKDDPLFFRKLVMGMSLEEVEPQRSAGCPVLYGDTSSDRARALASNESPTSADDVTDAELQAYINRPSRPGRRGREGAANRDAQPLLDPNNI